MLAQLQRHYPNIQSVQAFSHNLPFSSNFADAICCVQSFLLFANCEILQELYRVIKEDGWLVLIWNQRDIQVNWVKALADAIQPFDGDTPPLPSLYLARSVSGVIFICSKTAHDFSIYSPWDSRASGLESITIDQFYRSNAETTTN